MLAQHLIRPTIPASDMARAKAWYEDKLGLKPAYEHDAGAIYDLGGETSFLLYPTENAGKGPNTLMSFRAKDLDAEVAALKGRGVAFIDIDTPDLKTVNSIASIGDVRAAWFNDSEGNVLAIGNDPYDTA